MEDIRLKTEQFDYDGRSFTLACNMNVLADVQEAYGGQVLDVLRGKSSTRGILVYLAAMLNDCADSEGWPKRYTAKQLGRSLLPSQLDEIVSKIMPLIKISFIPREQENKPQGEDDGSKN